LFIWYHFSFYLGMVVVVVVELELVVVVGQGPVHIAEIILSNSLDICHRRFSSWPHPICLLGILIFL